MVKAEYEGPRKSDEKEIPKFPIASQREFDAACHQSHYAHALQDLFDNKSRRAEHDKWQGREWVKIGYRKKGESDSGTSATVAEYVDGDDNLTALVNRSVSSEYEHTEIDHGPR